MIKKTEYDNALKGVMVQELTASVRDKLGLPEEMTGIMITNVASDSPPKVCFSRTM